MPWNVWACSDHIRTTLWGHCMNGHAHEGHMAHHQQLYLDCYMTISPQRHTLNPSIQTSRVSNLTSSDSTQDPKCGIVGWWCHLGWQMENASIYIIVPFEFVHWMTFFVPTSCNTSQFVLCTILLSLNCTWHVMQLFFLRACSTCPTNFVFQIYFPKNCGSIL